MRRWRPLGSGRWGEGETAADGGGKKKKEKNPMKQQRAVHERVLSGVGLAAWKEGAPNGSRW